MSEQTDEKKYHTISPANKKKVIIGLFLFVLLTFPFLGFFYYKFAVNRPSQIVDETTYEIEKGATVSDISQDLYDLGILNSRVLFNFYAYWNKIDKNIQAGVYTIPAGISIVELADLLQHGVNDTKLTFIEGWRVEEYARQAAKKLSHVDYYDFLDLAENYEGTLFPDTYMVNAEINETDLVALLTSTFNKRTESILTKDKLEALGLSKEQVLIFASIVEREVRNPDDRPIVAGILIKRFEEEMPLEADATTQYATALYKFCVPDVCRNVDAECELTQEVQDCLNGPTKEEAMEIDWWPQDITAFDLAFDNPFNTRKVTGLPPSPICNPSLSAVAAVINHIDTDYYFYLTDKDGVTHYSVDYEGHLNNSYNYLEN